MTDEVQPGAKAGYHHGDLRRALLDAALALVASKGVANLSLRETARAAGVTHNAPYRHFPDKNALLAALAEDGFRQMAAEMVAARDGAGTAPEQRFLAIGLTYVRFAVGHPALFRVMFAPEIAERSDFPALRAAEVAAYDLCADAIRDCQAAGAIRPGDDRALALAAWAMMHGVATLVLDDFVGWTGVAAGDPEALARLMAGTLFQGLAP